MALGQRQSVEQTGSYGTTMPARSRSTSTFWPVRRREFPAAKARLAMVSFDFAARSSYLTRRSSLSSRKRALPPGGQSLRNAALDSAIGEMRVEAAFAAMHAIEGHHRKSGRVVEVTTKIIFGSEAAVQARLAASTVSQTINTSFVERNNLTCRQCNGRLARKVLSFSKELTWLEKHLWLSLAYYHFVLAHDSLSQRLSEPQPTRGSGSPKQWQPITPAMAAGITDHVWTMEELLSYRVPPDFRDQLDPQATNVTA